mgnify:CR=1 FL=1
MYLIEILTAIIAIAHLTRSAEYFNLISKHNVTELNIYLYMHSNEIDLRYKIVFEMNYCMIDRQIILNGYNGADVLLSYAKGFTVMAAPLIDSFYFYSIDEINNMYE